MDILIPAPPYKYALSWAATVVDEVQVRYPRATEIVSKVCNITPYDLAKFIAKPDPLWIYLRKAIQIGHRNMQHAPGTDHYTNVKRTIEDLLRRKPVLRGAEGFTELQFRLDWGSGNQKGGEAEAKRRPTPPSLSAPPPAGYDIY